jgi:UDP-galactopyranose mutase
MADFVTLQEAKMQLRVVWEDEDQTIQMLLDAAEDAVLNYIKKDWGWTSETVPKSVKLAILVLLSTYYEPFRDGDNFTNQIALGYPPPAVTALLHRFRSPAYA